MLKTLKKKTNAMSVNTLLNIYSVKNYAKYFSEIF